MINPRVNSRARDSRGRITIYFPSTRSIFENALPQIYVRCPPLLPTHRPLFLPDESPIRNTTYLSRALNGASNESCRARVTHRRSQVQEIYRQSGDYLARKFSSLAASARRVRARAIVARVSIGETKWRPLAPAGCRHCTVAVFMQFALQLRALGKFATVPHALVRHAR